MTHLASLWDELEARIALATLRYRSRVSRLHIRQKADRSLLSEADIEIETIITQSIRAIDPEGRLVAEEGTGYNPEPPKDSRSIWIIDPIDGTAEFLNPESTEFCSVVCLLDPDRRPLGAFVLAPEIGWSRTPVCIRLCSPRGPILVNGIPTRAGGGSNVSATRSRGSKPYIFEQPLAEAGFKIKTRTTSQTLDMVRLCVDLRPFTQPLLEPFALFYREQQKVWDGAAGISLALAAGLRVTDDLGNDRATIQVNLDNPEPTFESTLAGDPLLVDRLLSIISGSDRTC